MKPLRCYIGFHKKRIKLLERVFWEDTTLDGKIIYGYPEHAKYSLWEYYCPICNTTIGVYKICHSYDIKCTKNFEEKIRGARKRLSVVPPFSPFPTRCICLLNSKKRR